MAEQHSESPVPNSLIQRIVCEGGDMIVCDYEWAIQEWRTFGVIEVTTHQDDMWFRIILK
eukprot:10566071-Lingulodinium_polyedra.AAC.1